MKSLELSLRFLLPIVVGIVLYTNTFIAHAFNEMDFDWFFLSIFLVVVWLLFELNRVIINYLDRKNPARRSLGRRFLWPFGLSYLAVILFGTLVYVLVKTYEINHRGAVDTISLYHIVLLLTQLFFINAIASAFHQLRNFRNQWQITALKAEKLEKEQAKTQLTVLKNQISPHFLFNNFNTLHGLIQEDAAAASQFLEQLSNIYRSVLKYRMEEVISLEQELTTLSAYIYMLKTRFGESLQIEEKYDLAKSKHCFIPPFTLQLLIENAVKHNGFDEQNPLQIQLELLDKNIQVTNNYAPLKMPIKSTGMGLKNIQQRFNLLSDQQINIQQTDTFFSVDVPLLLINPI
ncbi:MAG: histidine kinase [Bacteroidota bacterium]